MFAIDVCNLPETGGSTFVLIAGLFVLVAGLIVARWVRRPAGRLSVVVAPLVLLGGLALAPQVTDPCAPATTTVAPSVTTVAATNSTTPSATTTVPSATTTTVAPSVTTVPSATTTVAPATTTTVAATTTTVALACASGGSCAVGSTGPGGGIVFYVDLTREPGAQYFEAAPVAVEVERSWATGSNREDVTGADGKAIGTGEQNTEEIVNQSGNEAATSAAVYCSELVSGGQSDWFLPSKDELNLMYTNLQSASTPLGGFSTVFYWSSSEYAANFAWYQYFNGGVQNSNPKGYTYYVRPVRAF